MKNSHERAQALWPIVSFDDAFVPASDFGLHIDKSNYAASGTYPVIDQGEAFIGGYTDDVSKVYRGPLPVVLFGDHTRRVKLVDFPFVVGAQGIKILCPTQSFEPRFLAQLVSTLPITDRGYGRHYALLRQQHFLCPPVVDQIRIVAEIEKQFTRLDAGVAALRRAQASLKRYRASVLNAACEGKLVPTEAELARAEGRDYESGAALLARILVERRASWAGRGKYKEPSAPDVASLPELPEGWRWATVEQVISELKNGYFAGAPSTNPPGTPTLRVSSVRAQRIDYDDVKFVPDVPVEKLVQYQLRVGDLLFTRYNGSLDLVGVCAVVLRIDRVLIYPDKLIRVRVPLELLDAKYVELYMATEFPRKAIESFSKSTAGQQGISGAELKQIHVRLPPLAEQQRIVAEVERRLSVIDELEAVVAANLQRAARLRQSVLQRAFSGEL